MAETPLRAVPSTEESIQQRPIATQAPDKALLATLNERANDAERLLFYAAEAGIDIEADVRDAVLRVKMTDANNWNEQTAANLLSALTTLATKVKPVTVDSLKICESRTTVDNTVNTYKKVAIWLAAVIIPFSLATFITSAISQAIRKDIEIANKLAVSLGDEVRSIRAQALEGQALTSKDTLPSDIRVRELQEFAAIQSRDL
jgi:hypothetical protein